MGFGKAHQEGDASMGFDECLGVFQVKNRGG